MNNHIAALHGRDTLPKISLFESARVKIFKKMSIFNSCTANFLFNKFFKYLSGNQENGKQESILF